MSRALSMVLVIGFGLMTLLAVSGRWMAGAGGIAMLLGGAVLYQQLRRGSQYLATALGLVWLGIGLGGLVFFLWGWF